MHWLFAVVAGLCSVEVLFRLPLPRMLRQFRALGARAAAVVASKRISDHWKERVVPAYALRLFRSTLGIVLCVLAVLAPFFLLALAAAPLGIPFVELSTSVTGILVTSCVAAVYARARYPHVHHGL